MDLFTTHMAECRGEYKKANPHSDPTDNDLLAAASEFLSSFSVPILPGDASLALEFISNLKCHIAHTLTSLADDRAIMSIGQVLFNLVILRTYMSRPAENDHNIFELVKDNQVSRVWTSHEQALAACFGEDDTSVNASFLTKPNPFLWKIKVLPDPNPELHQEHAFVTIRNPIVWTTGPGLTGGTRKPRHYRPPHLRLLEPGPRPKPRPAYGKRLSGMAEGGSTVVGDVEVGPPAKRGRHVELVGPMGNVAGAGEGMEVSGSPGVPARARRGTRKRKAVNF